MVLSITGLIGVVYCLQVSIKRPLLYSNMDIYIPITLGTIKSPDPAETIQIDQTYEEVEPQSTQQTCVKENEINREKDKAKKESSDTAQIEDDTKELEHSESDSNKELDLLLEEARHELDNELCPHIEDETDMSPGDGEQGNTIPDGSESPMRSASLQENDTSNGNTSVNRKSSDGSDSDHVNNGSSTSLSNGESACHTTDNDHNGAGLSGDEPTLEGAVGYTAPSTGPGPPDYGPGPPSYDEVMEATETYFQDSERNAGDNVKLTSSGSSEQSQEVNEEMGILHDGSTPPSYNALCAMLDRIAME